MSSQDLARKATSPLPSIQLFGTIFYINYDKFGVQNDRRDSCAEDYSYSGKTDAHQSAKDYSKGFGGKFGVQKDRQGTVNVPIIYSSLLI